MVPFSNFRLSTGVMFFRGFLDSGNSNVLIFNSTIALKSQEVQTQNFKDNCYAVTRM
jgi:hypothetical protein